MIKKDFFEKFSNDVLQISISIDEKTDLLDLPEWDSLAQIMTIAFLDKELNVRITIEDVRNFNTVADILSIGAINE